MRTSRDLAAETGVSSTSHSSQNLKSHVQVYDSGYCPDKSDKRARSSLN